MNKTNSLHLCLSSPRSLFATFPWQWFSWCFGVQENGIEAVFAPHPRPDWTLPWAGLPEAINPTEGKVMTLVSL